MLKMYTTTCNEQNDKTSVINKFNHNHTRRLQYKHPINYVGLKYQYSCSEFVLRLDPTRARGHASVRLETILPEKWSD